MENLKLLWEYQEVDLELDAFQKKLKNTPTRKQLLRLQRFVQTSQEKIQDMEKNAIVTQNRVVELEKQNKAYLEDMEDLNKDMGYFSECSEEELNAKEIAQLVKDAEKVFDLINQAKKQIAGMKHEIEKADDTIKDLFAKVKQAKVEYDGLLKKHNEELSLGSGDLEKQKHNLDAIAKKLPKEYFAEYKRIKSVHPNPVAVFENSMCSGCNMQLPSGIASRIASGGLVECENCGRILMLR